MKHLKGGQRSNLGEKSAEMAASVYGSACIEKSRMMANSEESTWTNTEHDFAEDLDQWGVRPDGSTIYEETLNHGESGMTEKQKPVRDFKPFQEPWERSIFKKKNSENEHKLLQKYLGLHLYDIDKKRLYRIVDDQLDWSRPDGKKRGGQYYLLAEPVDEELRNDPEFVEVWDFTEDLYESIAQTEQPKDLGVVIDGSHIGLA